jgi:deoxyribose-phosphate aldolase
MSLSNEEWALSIAKKASEVLGDTSECNSAFTKIIIPGDHFATAIDHTLLKPEATPAQIDQLCDEAIKYKFKA